MDEITYDIEIFSEIGPKGPHHIHNSYTCILVYVHIDVYIYMYVYMSPIYTPKYIYTCTH